MAEPDDAVTGPVVARRPVPAVHAVVRAELNHAEGDRGAGEGVAVRAGADEGVDEASEIFIRGRRLQPRPGSGPDRQAGKRGAAGLQQVSPCDHRRSPGRS